MVIKRDPADRISDDYRGMNQEMHEKRGSYGASGHRWVNEIAEILNGQVSYYSVLDYGCGKQTLHKAMREVGGVYTLWENYDPSIPALAAEPEPADLLVCTDVMEHIEFDKLENVLEHMQGLMRKQGFIVVATRPAKKTLPDGRNAHLIIRDPLWWHAKLGRFFDVTSMDCDVKQKGEVVFHVRPKEEPRDE